MSNVRLSFPQTQHPELELPASARLAEHLTVQNSPILFGCRTGLCGTCLCLAEGPARPASEDEREVLEIYAAGQPLARLACQLEVLGDMKLSPCPKAR